MGTREAKPLVKLFFFLYVLPLVFDYKGLEEGGGYAQFILLIVSLFFYLINVYLLLIQNKLLMLPNICKLIIFLWLVFFVVAIVSLIVNSVPFSQFIRVLLPFLLCFASMILVSLYYIAGYDLRFIVFSILIASVVSVFWSFLFPIFIQGYALESVRYLIISPLMPIFLVLSLMLVLSRDSNSIYGYFLLLVFSIVVLLSFTRSYILIVFMLFIWLLFCLKARDRRNFFILLLYLIVALVFFILLVFPILNLLNPEIINSWLNRLFNSRNALGYDLTSLTRIAEYVAQMEIVFSSTLKIIFGAGIGSAYYWSDEYFLDIAVAIPMEFLRFHEPWFAGHSLWVYSIYSSGVLFGLIIPFTYLVSLYFSFRLLRLSNLNSGLIVLVVSLMIVAYFPLTFTSHPLGSRLTGLMWGFLLLLPIFYFKKIQETK